MWVAKQEIILKSFILFYYTFLKSDGSDCVDKCSDEGVDKYTPTIGITCRTNCFDQEYLKKIIMKMIFSKEELIWIMAKLHA